jgi:transmembrane sensor
LLTIEPNSLKSHDEHIDLLISRFLTGEASDQEKAELARWMEASEANRKYFGDIEFVYKQATPYHPIVKVDVDQAWSKVRTQIHHKKQEPQKQTRIVAFRVPDWARVAAAAAVLLVVTVLLYRSLTPTHYHSPVMVSIHATDTVVQDVLPDSTVIFVNSNSSVKLASDYGRNERRVILEGEAFFDIKPLDNTPFIVESKGVFVKNLATAFNVRAFTGDSIVEVYVRKGKVALFTTAHQGIEINEGQAGIFNRNTGEFMKLENADANTVAYVSKAFFFNNSPLFEVIRHLNRVYGANIRLSSDQLKYCSISVSFEDEDIELILSIITDTLGLDVEQDEQGYIIAGQNCEHHESL